MKLRVRRACSPWSTDAAALAERIGRAPWIIEWQTASMSAPAFWMLESRSKARAAARRLRGQ